MVTNDTPEVQLDNLKSEFIAVVSHELRTPLTVARWSTELLLEGSYGAPLEGRPRDALLRTHHSLERLNSRLNNIITALIAAGKTLPSKRTHIALADALKKHLTEHHARCTAQGLTFTADIDDESLLVDTDPVALDYILHTLIENAIDYTPSGGSVALSAKRAACGCAELCVTDTGIGVPDEHRESIFTRFFRGDDAKHLKPDGLGLNLFIARAFAERHGGSLLLDHLPRESQGSHFVCLLPSAAPETTVLNS